MVDIIPRPVEQAGKWQKTLFYLLIFIVIVLIIIYFLLANLIQNSQVYSEELGIKITQGRTQERIELEEENIYYKNKIEAIAPFLNAHVLSSKFFDFLSAKTHPRIFFSKINLTAKEVRIALSGSTDSFSTLDQQLTALNEELLVEDVVLTNTSINKAGGIDFDLEISLNKKMFIY
ncbi:MAG: hypothetical protein KJI70_02140 [Patescibacteria group bacterium]|nr:hypothetical protein [Patescibacteria group bacterium]